MLGLVGPGVTVACGGHSGRKSRRDASGTGILADIVVVESGRYLKEAE
jgi:hypothetical protein